MVQSGYSYCSSTSSSPRCLKVKRVRFKPGCTRPSTVQTSRFSFFSRDTIFAFAPCNTASTRAMESFQRKPNGGNSSSAARADDTARQKATNPVGTILLIARHSLKLTQFAFGSSFQCVASIFDLLSLPLRHSKGGKNARARQFGQLRKESQFCFLGTLSF